MTEPTERELSKAGTTLGVAGGRARYEQLRESFPKAEQLSDYFRKLGKKSGKARRKAAAGAGEDEE